MPIRLFARRVLHTTMTGMLASALVLTLSSCSSNPTQPEQRKATPAKVQAKTSVNPSQLLEMARQRQSPERESLVLQAAQAYIEDSKFNRARDLLSDMSTVTCLW